MKLLFDQNISFRIISLISEPYPGSKQVKDLNLLDKTDLEIWEFARSNQYTIVTFDSDFYDLSVIRGVPPKIIWLRIGNTSTNSIANVLMENLESIKDFIEGPDYKDLTCLEID
jgi:predicted nuclease of predicted toxin-antitoxin system